MSSAIRPPLVWVSVDPKTDMDAERLADAIRQLAAEDSVRVRTEPLTGRRLIGGGSEDHLEVVIDRLHREFGVEAWLGRPEVAYREALTIPADGAARHALQTSSRGEYAHVKVRLSPGPSGTGCIIENQLTGGAIPPQYIPAVEEGIQDALTRGPVAGHRIHDVHIELCGGSYHDVDSTEEAFRVAGRLAAESAMRQAGPIVLEPMMLVEAVIPAECLVDVARDFASRRGEVRAQEDRGETVVMRALVPMARLWGYAIDLHSRTRGRGTSTMQFEEYAPLPSADGADDRDSLVRAPLKPAPTLGRPGIALPEPGDDPLS